MNKTELLSQFHTKLRDSIASDYSQWATKYDDLCAYAICAPPYFESIFPAYQLKSEELEDDLAFYPPEWSSFGELQFDDELKAICKTIFQRRTLYDENEEEGLDFASVFNTVLTVLIDLESEGLLGEKASGRYLTMWDVGNDEEWILKASEKLNSDSTHSAARRALLGED